MKPISKKARIAVNCSVNGADCRHEVSTSRVLADFLRDDLGLKGTKVSCGRSVCGACTVLIDGAPRAACSAFVFEADGCEIETVEGLEGKEGVPNPLQQAFIRRSAFQCGFCTSGMLMLLWGLLRDNPNPDRAEILRWVSSNTCRCTGYSLIVEAVEEAVHEMNRSREAAQ